MGDASPTCFFTWPTISARARSGNRRQKSYSALPSSTFFHRVAAYAVFSGSFLRSHIAAPSTAGRDRMYVGERCNMVTWAARSAIAGTSVTAVAPLPITTTRWSV